MHSTITSKGQITLPKMLRDQLHLSLGDRVEFILEENQSEHDSPLKIDKESQGHVAQAIPFGIVGTNGSSYCRRCCGK